MYITYYQSFIQYLIIHRISNASFVIELKENAYLAYSYFLANFFWPMFYKRKQYLKIISMFQRHVFVCVSSNLTTLVC